MFDFVAIAAYLQIIAINLVLSGDNVVVIGMAASGLEPKLRGRAIAAGIAAATLIRIVFAIIATKLLMLTGLLLAGGLLLLWVCWKMLTELRAAASRRSDAEGGDSAIDTSPVRRRTLGQAVIQIIIADVSMSLDNILAVAGAARQDIMALVFGLVLSVALMGLAAALVAELLSRVKWLGWAGLAIIAYVALTMIYGGVDQLVGGRLPAVPFLRSGEPTGPAPDHLADIGNRYENAPELAG